MWPRRQICPCRQVHPCRRCIQAGGGSPHCHGSGSTRHPVRRTAQRLVRLPPWRRGAGWAVWGVPAMTGHRSPCRPPLAPERGGRARGRGRGERSVRLRSFAAGLVADGEPRPAAPTQNTNGPPPEAAAFQGGCEWVRVDAGSAGQPRAVLRSLSRMTLGLAGSATWPASCRDHGV